MIKELKFSRIGNYNGRNGNAPMYGAEIMETETVEGNNIMLSPINSRAAASSTWYEIPREDLPQLVAELALLLPIKEQPRTYALTVIDGDGNDKTSLFTTNEDLSMFTGNYTDVSVFEDEWQAPFFAKLLKLLGLSDSVLDDALFSITLNNADHVTDLTGESIGI